MIYARKYVNNCGIEKMVDIPHRGGGTQTRTLTVLVNRIIFLFHFFYYFINAIISTLHISSLYCCLHLYLAHSYILLYFDVFSPLLKSTLLATKNVSPLTVFDLGG